MAQSGQATHAINVRFREQRGHGWGASMHFIRPEDQDGATFQDAGLGRGTRHDRTSSGCARRFPLAVR